MQGEDCGKHSLEVSWWWESKGYMNVIKEGWQFVLESPKEQGVDFGHLCHAELVESSATVY